MTGRVKEWEQRGLSQNDRQSKGEGTEGVYLRMIESQLGTYIDVNEKMCRG